MQAPVSTSYVPDVTVVVDVGEREHAKMPTTRAASMSVRALELVRSVFEAELEVKGRLVMTSLRVSTEHVPNRALTLAGSSRSRWPARGNADTA